MTESDKLNRISGDVLDAAIRIHSALGPGLNENVYEIILARALVRKGYRVERQKPLSFDFEGMWFQDICRPDLIVDGAVVVEVKSAERLHPVFGKQVLTYLRVGDYRLGLVVNFGGALLKDNFQRVVNGF